MKKAPAGTRRPDARARARAMRAAGVPRGTTNSFTVLYRGTTNSRAGAERRRAPSLTRAGWSRHESGAAWSCEWVLSLKCCGALLYLKVELHCSSCCSSTLNKNAVQLHAALDSSYLKWHQCDSALVLVHHQELCRRRNQPMACRPQSPSPRPAVKQKQKARA